MSQVLIVEDEPAYQKILKDALEKEHLEVFLASTSNVAMKKIDISLPDVILLDIMLPGGENGFDLLERLKRNNRTKAIPVIILTNLDSEEKVSKQIGASSYFVKSDTNINDVINKTIELTKIN